VTALARRRAIALIVLIGVSGAAWYTAQPTVPDGQAPLVTLDAASFATLRDTFNRDADHVRIIVLPAPT
jgi:hypothetical protein